jgi:predicted MPP superfamily phosphohydrolase
MKKYHKFSAILLTAFLFISFFKLSAQNTSGNALQFVVSPYLQDAGGNSFSVMWETSQPVKGQVYLAKAEFHILKPELKPVAKENTPVRLHHLVVDGLKKDELYFYQAVNITENGDTLKGPVSQITIPDYDKSTVSFSVIGDIQGGIKTWEDISKLMIRERPQFIVHVGDLVSNGPNDYEWVDEFFKPAAHLLSQVPLYPAIGNHEQNASNFYRYFHLPENDAFFTVKKGPVRFIFADTNKDLLPGSEQYRRLERELAGCEEPWKIVVHHHPVFTSGNAAYRSSLMATAAKGDPNILHLRTLYETYGVDLVLNGHVHTYEKSWPIYKNHINRENGVMYIITGGGGGGFRELDLVYKNWFTSEKILTHHFLNIQIHDNALSMKMIDDKGNVIDTWEKTKNTAQAKLNPPIIKTLHKYFTDSASVTIENPNTSGNITYRLNDGSYTTVFEKEAQFNMDNTTTITAFTSSIHKASNEVYKTVVKMPLMSSRRSNEKKITADYYEGYFTLLPDFDQLTPTRSFEVNSISMDEIRPRVEDHFAVRFKGSISIPETDVYRFFLESFDGSMLLIDGKEIIKNDGVHYEIFREGYAALEKGNHDIEVRFFDFVRRETLNLRIGKQDGEMVDIKQYITGGSK